MKPDKILMKINDGEANSPVDLKPFSQQQIASGKTQSNEQNQSLAVYISFSETKCILFI